MCVTELSACWCSARRSRLPTLLLFLLTACADVRSVRARANTPTSTPADTPFLAPVRIPFYRNDFVRLYVGKPGQVMTFAVDERRDEIYLYSEPASSSATYEVDTSDTSRGTEVFYFSDELLRVPVRYGVPLDGLEAYTTDIQHDGILGLGRASIVWRYWTSFTRSPYALTFGTDDEYEGYGARIRLTSVLSSDPLLSDLDFRNEEAFAFWAKKSEGEDTDAVPGSQGDGAGRGLGSEPGGTQTPVWKHISATEGGLAAGPIRFVAERVYVDDVPMKLEISRHLPYSYLPPQLLHRNNIHICFARNDVDPRDRNAGTGVGGEWAVLSHRGDACIRCMWFRLDDLMKRHSTNIYERTIRRNTAVDGGNTIVLGRDSLRYFTVYYDALRNVATLRRAFRVQSHESATPFSLYLFALLVSLWIVWTVVTNAPGQANYSLSPRDLRTKHLVLFMLEGYALLVGLLTFLTFSIGASGSKIIRHLTHGGVNLSILGTQRAAQRCSVETDDWWCREAAVASSGARTGTTDADARAGAGGVGTTHVSLFYVVNSGLLFVSLFLFLMALGYVSRKSDGMFHDSDEDDEERHMSEQAAQRLSSARTHPGARARGATQTGVEHASRFVHMHEWLVEHTVHVLRRAFVSSVLLFAAWMCTADIMVSAGDVYYLIILGTLLAIFNGIYALEACFRHGLLTNALLAALAGYSYWFLYRFGLSVLTDLNLFGIPSTTFLAILYYMVMVVFPTLYLAIGFYQIPIQRALSNLSHEPLLAQRSYLLSKEGRESFSNVGHRYGTDAENERVQTKKNA